MTSEAVDVELMQADKFKAADLLLNCAERWAAAVAASPLFLVLGPMRLRGAGADDTDGAPPEHVPTTNLATTRVGFAAYFKHLNEEELGMSAILR